MRGLSNPLFSDKEAILQIETNSPEETVKKGKALGLLLKKGDFIALSGNLGAGKTTFAKGLLSAYMDPSAVKSPSFTIVSEYQVKEDFKVFHLDLYRVDFAALDDIGYVDFLEQGAVVAEWPEKMIQFVPNDALIIEFEHAGENSRILKFIGGKRWKKRLQALK